MVLDRDFNGDYPLPEDAVRLTVGDARLGNALSVGDPVRLLTAGGRAVSTYAAPFNPGDGVSAERVAPDAGDAPDAWRASPCGASPGRVNCLLDPAPAELVVSEVMANPIDEGTGEYVELFNAGEAPIDLAGGRCATVRGLRLDGGHP